MLLQFLISQSTTPLWAKLAPRFGRVLCFFQGFAGGFLVKRPNNGTINRRHVMPFSLGGSQLCP